MLEIYKRKIECTLNKTQQMGRTNFIAKFFPMSLEKSQSIGSPRMSVSWPSNTLYKFHDLGQQIPFLYFLST